MFFRRAARPGGRRPSSRSTARPSVESLESRLVPYSATGNVWPHPQLITLSFVPDGTVMALGNGGNITSNLFATLNAVPGITSPSQWQNIILKAAQSWAAQTNINFAVVGDDGSPAGSGSYQQGAPNFGDIRIGGYNFGSSCSWLASTFYPPSVNNYSVAGDVAFNTGYSFNVGSTYDLFTVAEHEIGHALGLACTSTSTAVMYTTYTGAFNGLGTDDINGIRAVYSGGNPRAVDAYDSGGGNNSFANAANISSAIDPNSLTAVLNNLSISSTVNNQDTVTNADVAYYKFTAPANSASTMTVTVQSAGLSLLSPLVTVYASDQKTVLGTANGRGQYGTTLTLSGIAVTPGSTYYVKVQGADSTVFGTGAYALTLNLGTAPRPTVAPLNTRVSNGPLLSAGGGVPMEPASAPSAGVALYSSAAQANFNGTAIPAGDTVWFSSVVKVSGAPLNSTTHLYVSAGSITCTAGGTFYSIAVPAAVITLSPTATTATTAFNAACDNWVTVVPSSLGVNTFVAGLALPVPASGLPGGIQNISWQAQFTSDVPGLKVQWQWGAAVYQQFTTNYAALGVKPVDGNQGSAFLNADHAGTPESFKSFVTAGGTGSGGTDYTGGHSGTASVTAPAVSPTASLSGSVIDQLTGAGLAGVTVTLTGTTLLGQSVTLTATTAANGSFSFVGVPAGVYTLSESLPANSLWAGDVIGSLGGSAGVAAVNTIDLMPGLSGYGYGFENFG